MRGNGARKLTGGTPTAIRRTYSQIPLAAPPDSLRETRDHRRISLGNVLKACKQKMDFKAATAAHSSIIKLGYETYPSTIACLISAYVHCDGLVLANRLLDQVFWWDFDLLIMNLIVENLMKVGQYGFARKVFNKMDVRDVVTWNSMIGGYVKNARFEEAIRLFRQMISSEVEPDKFTFASVMTGCARLGAPDLARWIHGLMIEKKIEIESNAILSSALIDMYSKCGRIETAKEVFESVKRDNVSIWNAMICGLAVHGLASDVVSVFSRMEAENVLPDSITFIGILTACSHSGLIEEGRRYFDLMSSRYLIQPHMEHYGAVVDLFARAGKLEEAYAIIKSMPMEPDVVIWRALLSASRTYMKPDLGEVAIQNIARLKGGDYVLLSNTYCSLKKWNSSQMVREAMKKNGVRKKRGKSWVELAGVLHQFTAGDKSHPETLAIYRIVEALIQRTKSEGFLPELDLVLMDVSEEEKEENLGHHSEKLALAYAILKTSPGREILISKNLRMCPDCHSWIKMVSKLLCRVVIVRDRIRFHRFESGFCSCGDYW